MKWLFRIIGFTLLAFIGLCVLGYFLPRMQVVDSNILIQSDRDVIYEVLADLRSYPEWTGIGGDDSEWVFGGAVEGTGQTAAWQAKSKFGSLEILQSTPGEFVLLKTVGPLGAQTVTLALQDVSKPEDGFATTHFLIEGQQDLGGFPYFGRLASLRRGGQTKRTLVRAADGLKLMTEGQN